LTVFAAMRNRVKTTQDTWRRYADVWAYEWLNYTTSCEIIITTNTEPEILSRVQIAIGQAMTQIKTGGDLNN